MGSDRETLGEFIDTYRLPSRGWATTALPDDVKEQILSMPHVGDRKIVRWLHKIGFVDATDAKVEHFRQRSC